MHPQYTRRRILSLCSYQPIYFRKFLLHTITLNGLFVRSRPEPGFLQIPVRRLAIRLISTETKEWLRYEVKMGLKYSILISITGIFLVIMASGIQEEYRARIYPTPEEWKWNTRLQFRAARAREDSEDPWMKNWMAIGNSYQNVIEKLEDPNREGQAICEKCETTLDIPVRINGCFGYDISSNSENWRRAYYETLMGLVRVAEQLDNHVKDKTKISNLAWPAKSVIGPSNPRPRPLPIGMPPPPREELCTAAFEAPEVYYTKILTTHGFTEKQKIDTAISYGLWLDCKGKPDLALKIYEWAVNLANSKSSPRSTFKNSSNDMIDNDIRFPSENSLSATTALALHYARNSKVELALPMLVFILKARKSLPMPPPTIISTLENAIEDSESNIEKITALVKKYMKPPRYPPPPTDGTGPPYRNAKERCEEASLMLYIGEILFATGGSKPNRDEGLAWTRKAVDNSEAELRQKGIDVDARKICKQCLEVSLQNWKIMIEKLIREDEEKTKVSSNNWFNFREQKSLSGKWENEKEIIQSRIDRARSLLNE